MFSIVRKWQESNQSQIMNKAFSKENIDKVLHGFEKEKKILIRCPITLNNEVKKFVESGKRSMLVKIKVTENAINHFKLGYKLDKSSTITVRLVRVELDKEIEVLATNLFDLKKY